MAAPTINTPFQPYVYQSPQAVITPFQILGGEAQIVQILLLPGQTVQAEPGAMCYMSGSINVATIIGPGGFVASFRRWVSGESFFTNTFVNRGPLDGYIGFATPTLAKILPLDLQMYGGEIICQRDAYLCSINEVMVTSEVTKRVRVGIFGGEVRLKIPSLPFLRPWILYAKVGWQGFGLHNSWRINVLCKAFCLHPQSLTAWQQTVVQKNLGQGEVVVVDAGCVVAMTKTVDFDIKYVGSIKRAVFGGEGLFYAHLTGPGVVFLQSLPFSRLARRVHEVMAIPRQKDTPNFLFQILIATLFVFFIGISAFVFQDAVDGNLNFQWAVR
eukprot:SM000049S16702  [mRNA]  locus=s49:109683:112792:- [translate_table: standard]